MEALAVVSGLLFSYLLFSLTWILSVKKRDVSLVDRIWGLAYIANILGYLCYSNFKVNAAQFMVLILVLIWGARLSIHIHLRNLGHGEDGRYQKIRSGYETGFWWKSYFTIFLFQWLLAAIISLPLFYILISDAQLSYFWAGLSLIIWLIGFVFEAGGDWQLTRFKKDPNNKGKLLNTGFWKLTRHPNYFGDGMVWWGLYVLALSLGGWWTVISPVIMTLFLRKVSGVDLLESQLKSTKPGYEEYIRTTPAFIPRLWPKKEKH